MPFVLLFSTTSFVTSQLIRELQQACQSTTTFFPARIDPSKQPVCESKVCDDVVEVFEDATTPQLRQSLAERRPSNRKKGKCVNPRAFVVLDEQSVQDHTVVFHAEGPVDDGHDTDEFHYEWFQWRVRFEHAEELIISLLGEPWEVVEDVLLNSTWNARYTGSDGVFAVKDAIDEYIKRGDEMGSDAALSSGDIKL